MSVSVAAHDQEQANLTQADCRKKNASFDLDDRVPDHIDRFCSSRYQLFRQYAKLQCVQHQLSNRSSRRLLARQSDLEWLRFRLPGPTALLVPTPVAV
jgi:hypothetical protein